MAKSESIDNFSSEQEGGSKSTKKLSAICSKQESVEEMEGGDKDLRKSLSANRYNQPEDDDEASQAFPGLIAKSSNLPSHVEFLEDELGNIIQLEEVEVEQSANEGDLIFFDERKELVKETNFFGRFVSRLTILLVTTLVCFVWVQDYVINKAWERIQYTWALVFVGVQLLTYFVIQPLLLWLNAFCFANRVYYFLFCGSENFLYTLFPVHLMLYQDLLD